MSGMHPQECQRGSQRGEGRTALLPAGSGAFTLGTAPRLEPTSLVELWGQTSETRMIFQEYPGPEEPRSLPASSTTTGQRDPAALSSAPTLPSAAVIRLGGRRRSPTDISAVQLGQADGL
ncbi:hypothetical protein EYF80_013682 [Liparis tanakae]|uniref:Uncharacterized protein n=1 Tax=Liparis tanakae TaxID=230148 RepID=A0A4Z2IEF8_9TELE|nr:hypothetical protein EYF80_013682 [Liparis tanakae]